MGRQIAGEELTEMVELFRVQVIFPGGSDADKYLFTFHGPTGQIVKIWRPRTYDLDGFQDPVSAYTVLGGKCTCPGFEHRSHCKHSQFAALAREAWEANQQDADVPPPGAVGCKVFDYRKFPKET